jgi:hypothetical protein
VERHVPVSATDLEFDPNELSPIRLSVASVRQLLHVFDQVIRACKGEEANESQSSDSIVATTAHVFGEDDSAFSSMDSSHGGSAASLVAGDRAHLPGDDSDPVVLPEEGGDR